ncbi:MAG: hypothetical protein QMB08_03865 [Acidimicrobiales bacterium]
MDYTLELRRRRDSCGDLLVAHVLADHLACYGRLVWGKAEVSMSAQGRQDEGLAA